MGDRDDYKDSLPFHPAKVFFLLLWPLFARAPRHWFLENFLLSAPGVQSVFFLLRSVGRRDLSAGPEQKKTPPRVFFFGSGPGKGKGRRSPLAPARGQSKKKTPWVVFFFFCCGPARMLTHSLRAWVAMPPPRRGGVIFFAAAPPGPGWCFFLLWPRPDAHSLTVGWGDFGKARVVFFFLLRPRRVFFRQ